MAEEVLVEPATRTVVLAEEECIGFEHPLELEGQDGIDPELSPAMQVYLDAVCRGEDPDLLLGC